jgi:hypothetical protein
MMRLSALVLCLALGPVAALADTAPDKPAPRPRLTTEQRFELANTSADGKLTLDQARLGYREVARNFAAIDLSGRGYVTVEDILGWQRANREARRTARMLAEDPLRPRPAMQRGRVIEGSAAVEPTWADDPED